MAAGLLDGYIAAAIYAGFKGRLLKGTLRRNVPSGNLDDYGDATATSPSTWTTEGFTELYSDFFRAQARIPETDLKVNIFAKSLTSGVRPRKDDLASFTQAGVVTWYQLRNATVDPAGALWTCRAFVVPAPLESV